MSILCYKGEQEKHTISIDSFLLFRELEPTNKGKNWEKESFH
jgi:hypothetical protein